MSLDPELIDWSLGQLPAADADPVRRRLEQDPRAALQAAELKALVEDLRTLTVEPSGRVGVALRYAVRRRVELRRRRRLARVNSGAEPRWLLRVAGLVAVTIGALAVGLGLRRQEAPAVPAAQHDRAAAPRLAPPGRARVTLVADEPLTPEHDLALLRLEFTFRLTPDARRLSIRLSGGRDDLEDRIQDLAAGVAARLEASLAAGDTAVADAALALRALLAAGSTDVLGHPDVVHAAQRFLEQRVLGLEGGELATALSALTDLAVLASGPAVLLVAEHGTRLARATLAERGGHTLLQPATPVASLADAGQVLRLLPAFGGPQAEAVQARRLLLAHLEARRATAGSERPDVLAAELYGYGDLVDRAALDGKLARFSARELAEQDLVTLHHWSWGQLPVRRGFADAQRALRDLAILPTPKGVRDAAALLLSLSMSFAAPGARELVAGG